MKTGSTASASACFFGLLGLLGLLPSSAIASSGLIDVEFNGGGGTPAVGYAAIGVTSSDYWNYYSNSAAGVANPSSTLSNLKFVDGTTSGVGLAVTNATGSYGYSSSTVTNAMFDKYMYAVGANISLTVTNLSAGVYDFYLYGHGNADNQNSVFQLSVGGASQGSESTTTSDGWNSTVWQEGMQYVEFTNVNVAAGQIVTIQVEPGGSSYSPLNGMQIEAAGATTPVVTVNSLSIAVAENISSPVTLSGSTSDSGTLVYTVVTQPTNGTLSGTPPNLTYLPATNYTGSDGFTFEVNEGSITSAVVSVNISVVPLAAMQTIDVEFNGGGNQKTGFAAIGATTNDYWNYYIVGGPSEMTDLKFVSGVASAVGLSVNNATGADANGASDAMYGAYAYASPGGSISLSITNLSAGVYDFYLYGHGNVNNQNSIFQLSVGTVNEGSEATLNGVGWNSTVWQEGVQYVEFTNTIVGAGQTITVQVQPGVGGYACLGGMQIATVNISTNGAPIILQSPVSQTVNSGTQVSFGAVAGGGPSTVQWYVTNALGTNLVTGGTSIPLSVAANDGTAGGYEAVFSNSFGMATTAVAVLSVIDPPSIITSPLSQTATGGTQVTFTASASGTTNAVQWYLINYLGTNAVSGATTNTLKVIAGGPTAGGYYAVFHNSLGSAPTGVANLGVLGLPLVNGSFETNTNGTVIAAGNGLLLSPGATWMQGWTVGGPGNDVSVEDGTVDGLAPYDGKQWIDFHWYSNPSGGSLAQTFTTTVGQSYVVTYEVSELRTGGPSLTAKAYGSNNVVLASNYCVPPTPLVWTQFQLSFAAVSTNTTLLFTDTSASGTPDLNFDAVAIVSPPVIVTNPVSQTVTNGNSVTFTAAASGSPSTVQWWNNVTNLIPNATNATLTFTASPGSGGYYSAVFSNAAGTATTTAALLTVDNPVFLTQQPQSVTTNLGANVTFTGAAGGGTPINLQWQFDGTNIVGATNADLVVSDVQLTNAGNYVLLATNAYGWAASSNAVLSIVSTLQVVSTNVAGASTVTVPVNLIATGNESVATFSLDFDPTVLTFMGITPGSGASGAAFTPNTNQAASGHIGLLVGYVGGNFSAGTQAVAQATFAAVLATNTVATTISFGGSPTSQKIIDASFDQLAGAYLAGTVTVTPTSLEGDVWPRPNGNYVLDANDWLQEGRFVVGLDTVSNASEMQRADCAPRSVSGGAVTSGDGEINALDLAQAGRYVVGLDPLTAMAGPDLGSSGSVVAKAKGAHSNAPGQAVRTLSLVPMTNVANAVTVQLLAAGDENTVDFSLAYDPTMASFVSATPGAGTTGALFVVNSNTPGKLGIALALQPGQTFPAGTNNIVQLDFNPVDYSNTVALVFTNSPAQCSVSDPSASTSLPTTYQNGSLVVGGTVWPTLNIGTSGANISLSWPATATNFTVQMTTNLTAAWSAAGGTTVTNGATISITLPAPTNSTFYRLSQP